MTELGSESWMGASDYDEGDELHNRATGFVNSIHWDRIVSYASGLRNHRCNLGGKYSLGHFNLVRRLTFDDGVDWVVRLRLPECFSMSDTREKLSAADCMRIEIATMTFLRRKTHLPVPIVHGHDLSPTNEVGAPYMLMDYIHGTTAIALYKARGCAAYSFGTSDQNQRFRRQMARIQVELASLTFDRIGSLWAERDFQGFTIGAEIETGEGPWETAESYYSALTDHRLRVAETDAEPDVRTCDSFALPRKFPAVIQQLQSRATGPYHLGNRDFGAHNVLVDHEFNIVGLIDFDGVLAAPIEVVAQPPDFMGLAAEVPGHVETRPIALERIERDKHLLPQYVGFLRDAIKDRETATSQEDHSGLADAVGSKGAMAVQGLAAYGMHSASVNDRWMAAYDHMLQP